MTRLTHTLALVGLLCGVLSAWPVIARITSPNLLNVKRLEAVKLSSRGPNAEEAVAPPRVKNITFANPKASQFFVDGTTIPEVNFDVGPSWAGLIPISAAPDESRKLFFWFFPPGLEGSLDDLIFWTNGGPGYSSLEGLLKENGPFLWGPGQARPTQNEYSWTNLSSVLYVEQPVGTGYSQGTPDAKNENDVAAQLVGFLQQFLEIFSELKGKKFYFSGESQYAGMYIPYIANFIFENTRSTLDLDLQGLWMNDPVLSWDIVHRQIPAVDFVHKYEHVFAFNHTFLAQLDSVATMCNYSDYMAKHVTYPPQGLLPLPGASTDIDLACEAWDVIIGAAQLINPAFNIYHVLDTSVLWDVWGFPVSAQDTLVYYDRADVKGVIHAPLTVDWELSNFDGPDVFPDGDVSLPPAFTVLPNGIEKSKRSVIVHGLADFILIAKGTRIVLQNFQVAGMQGFREPLLNDSFIVDGVGALGKMQSERGLTYVEISLAGHQVPGYSPVASLQVMK
ncbi:alpha/beta-hydrolase [Lactarius akahatsu]|uniref:Alpha/beta-hydrolase n=1 Tax=Lactarius akahatsu TaxID=416441 RepID=A0AAD4QHC5_9AGAM|nr:alpha/beta-hydrolase [Lactarius akahatsu]